MEPESRSRFNPEILGEALSRYGVTESGLRELDGFESFIYQCRRNGTDLILRISHSLHRSAAQIAGEVAWISLLAAEGVNACQALPSLNGEMFEALGDGDAEEYFTAALFNKAPGAPTGDDQWQPSLFSTMGTMMGHMHRLTRSLEPCAELLSRPQWFDDIGGSAEKFLPSDQSVIIDKFNQNIETTHLLPKKADQYGLVHFDFHRGNFFLDRGHVHLFDFDDCQYSWFADDIAIALFYALAHDCSSEKERQFARLFMEHFLDGYRSHCEISREWLERIPLFLKRREMDLYTVIHRSLDLDNLDPWPASFMERRRHKIENDVPWVDIDFSVF